MKRSNFYQLTRNVQDRFISACRGQTLPKPILVQPVRAPFPIFWAGGALVALAIFVALLLFGFGRLDTAFALSPPSMLVAFSVTLIVGIYMALQAIARWSEARRVPFPRGRLLFPVGLIDASSANLSIRPIDELVALQQNGSQGVRARFADGSSFTFPLPDGAALADVERAVAEAKEKMRSKGDNVAIETLADPLSEPRFSNPLAPRAAFRAPVPSWRKFTPLIALLSGGLVGGTGGLVRNKLSERKMYQAARTADTQSAYRAYVEFGGKKRDIPELWLPTAELRDIVAAGTLAELETYATENPGSKIRPSIDLALRSALLAELAEAKKPGTISALDAFAGRHPRYLPLVGVELQVAKNAVMERLQENFVERFAADEEDLAPFFARLLAYLAHHGPSVKVRFHRVVPESVAKADEIVQRNKYFAKSMLPSQYFNEARSSEREALIFGRLEKLFNAAFPKDALSLELGEPLSSAEKIPSRPERPTLFLSHSTNMGRGIPNLKPNGTFVGIGFLFKARFVIPGDDTTLNMKYSAWRLPDLLRLRKGKLTISGVYLEMAENAFGGFDERLLGWLFRKDLVAKLGG